MGGFFLLCLVVFIVFRGKIIVSRLCFDCVAIVLRSCFHCVFQPQLCFWQMGEEVILRRTAEPQRGRPQPKVGWEESHAKGAKTARVREENSCRDPEPLRFSELENFGENAQLGIALRRCGEEDAPGNFEPGIELIYYS
ncbi:MAG: hypothetical protein JWM99_4170 [Verrucomicrobiales bacterium]|nr:hypothetical protein [Verrucomicrobiales bacterium]